MFRIQYGYSKSYENVFSSYDKHIIWRYINLNLAPITKTDKEIIERYVKFLETEKQEKEVEFEKIALTVEENKVDYGKVLSLDEAINRYNNKKGN